MWYETSKGAAVGPCPLLFFCVVFLFPERSLLGSDESESESESKDCNEIATAMLETVAESAAAMSVSHYLTSSSAAGGFEAALVKACSRGRGSSTESSLSIRGSSLVLRYSRRLLASGRDHPGAKALLLLADSKGVFLVGETKVIGVVVWSSSGVFSFSCSGAGEFVQDEDWEFCLSVVALAMVVVVVVAVAVAVAVFVLLAFAAASTEPSILSSASVSDLSAVFGVSTTACVRGVVEWDGVLEVVVFFFDFFGEALAGEAFLAGEEVAFAFFCGDMETSALGSSTGGPRSPAYCDERLCL